MAISRNFMDSQVIAQFVSHDDVLLGPVVQLPVSITKESLYQLLPPEINQNNQIRMFVFGSEIITSLADALKSERATNEETLKIYCYPDEPEKKTRAPGYMASSCSGHKAAILSVKGSPCGKYICSASGDGTVRFWCSSTKSPLKAIRVHHHWVQVVEFSPNSKYVAAGAMDGGVSLISVPEMEIIYSKKVHRDGVTSISWRKDSEKFATAGRDSSAGIWGLAGHLRSIFHEKPVITVAYFGDYLLSAGRDFSIKVTNREGTLVQTLKGHTQNVTNLAVHNGTDMGRFLQNKNEYVFGSGKSFLVSTSDDRTGIIWRTEWEEDGTWRFMAKKKLVGHKDIITCVSISNNGIHIATSSFDKTVRLWTSMNGYLAHIYRAHTSLAYQTKFSKTGNLLVSSSADKTVKVYSVEKKKLLSDFVCKDQVFAIDIQEAMIVAGGKDKLVYFFT
ncbi:ribosome assembly protein 4 [Nematocida homosporus]|uniref:ribosome assembly protein 4 n=1 Tax=Nematocida homosporus TaxID=1912981 RepID=UPI00222068B2|nr:ribosome assembly protein 4 [Nematocida homosporus]KAI5185707.1 ribosome assembly protein 4 [Nematocida homosporus]